MMTIAAALDAKGEPRVVQNVPTGGDWPRFFLLREERGEAPQVTRVVATLQQNGIEYVDFVRQRSDAVWQAFQGRKLDPAAQDRWTRMAQESLAEQARLEAGETLDFEAFRQDYVSAQRLG